MLVFSQNNSYKQLVFLGSVALMAMVLLIAGCKSEQTDLSPLLEGVWLGCYSELNEKVPRVRLFDLKSDHTYTSINFEKETIEGTWSTKNNTLLIDTIEMEVGKLAGDSLVLENKLRVIYKKTEDAPFTKTKTELENSIEDTAWESVTKQGSTKLYFTYEKVYYLPANGQLEVYCWKVDKYQDLAILYYIGNKHNCKKNASGLKQLLELDDKSLRFRNYSDTHRGTQSFTKTTFKESDIKELETKKVFQKCTAYNSQNCGTIMNVNTDPAKAINYYFEKFKPIPNTKNQSGSQSSGYLRLRFKINCKGQVANFDLEGMNENYEAFKFDERISDQFIQLTKEIDNWIGYEWKGDLYDCDKNMLFKIKNGLLVDISP